MEKNRLLIGMLWGTMLSVPLWLSAFGWVKIVAFFVR